VYGGGSELQTDVLRKRGGDRKDLIGFPANIPLKHYVGVKSCEKVK